VCQSVSDLAVELEAPIITEDFRTMNQCLDDATASAVTEHARGQAASSIGKADELRNLTDAAIAALEISEPGRWALPGAPAAPSFATSSPYGRSVDRSRPASGGPREAEPSTHEMDSKP
jgi:hypothetical protein